MNLKRKLNSFFKTKRSSDAGVELLKMFILPFMKAWNPRAGVDDALAAFFVLDDRKIYHGNAAKAFKMPGEYKITESLWGRRAPHRVVAKGQYMLIAADRKSQTARVDVELMGKERSFKLSRAELEYLKDKVEMREV
jgi:hypothetical protein